MSETPLPCLGDLLHRLRGDCGDLLVDLDDPGNRRAVSTHDVWFHDCLGWFSVRIEGGTVTGVAGPLSWHQALDFEFDPATCTFDGSEWATRRARESPEQFMTLEKWLRGGTEYRPQPLLLEVAVSVLADWSFRLRRWLRLY